MFKFLIIQYKLTLNLHLLYRIYNCVWIYPIIQWYIYIYIYIYILYVYIIYILYVYIIYSVFCLFQHCYNIHACWSHWFHIHIFCSRWFCLIIITSRNSLPNCKHDPSYQQRSQVSNIVLKSSYQKCSILKAVLKI